MARNVSARMGFSCISPAIGQLVRQRAEMVTFTHVKVPHLEQMTREVILQVKILTRCRLHPGLSCLCQKQKNWKNQSSVAIFQKGRNRGKKGA